MLLLGDAQFLLNTEVCTAPPSVDDSRDKSHLKLPIVFWVINVYLDDIGAATRPLWIGGGPRGQLVRPRGWLVGGCHQFEMEGSPGGGGRRRAKRETPSGRN